MSARQSIVLGVLAVWLVVVGVQAHSYVRRVLSLPDLGEGYVTQWDFQLLMFAIFRLPLFLAGLGLVLLAVWHWVPRR